MIKELRGATIWSENVNNLLPFYRDALGLPVAVETPGFVVLGDRQRPTLALGTHSEVRGRNADPARHMVALTTDDITTDWARLKAAGVEFVEAPTKYDALWIATLKDPEGNLVQLLQFGAKSQALVKRFEDKVQGAIATLQTLGDADWRKVTAAEQWSVGVTAHHYASTLGPISDGIKAVLAGRSLNFTAAVVDEMNARHARDHAGCTRAETITLLEQGAAAAAAVIRGLSDEQLATSGTVVPGAPPMTVEQLITGGLLDHIDEHFGSIRNTIGNTGQESGMKTAPQKEHEWLQKLVGDWTYEGEATMGPGKPPEKFEGTETVRSLGGLWIVAEGTGEMPGGVAATTLLTLGYDPRTKRYVGTWVGSMMAHLWVYDGALDAGETALALDAEGPSMAGDGKTAKYRDVIELRSDDHRVLTSHLLGDDGKWHAFMTAHYRRTGAARRPAA